MYKLPYDQFNKTRLLAMLVLWEKFQEQKFSASACKISYWYFWWALLILWEKLQGQKFSESTSTGRMNSPDIAQGWLHPLVYLSTLFAMCVSAHSNSYGYFWWALLKLWEKFQGQKFSTSPQVQVAWTVRTSPSACYIPAFTYQLCWQCQSGSTGRNQ